MDNGTLKTENNLYSRFVKAFSGYMLLSEKQIKESWIVWRTWVQKQEKRILEETQKTFDKKN